MRPLLYTLFIRAVTRGNDFYPKAEHNAPEAIQSIAGGSGERVPPKKIELDSVGGMSLESAGCVGDCAMDVGEGR